MKRLTCTKITVAVCFDRAGTVRNFSGAMAAIFIEETEDMGRETGLK